MLLIQFTADGGRAVGILEDDGAVVVLDGVTRVVDLARAASSARSSLDVHARAHASGRREEYRVIEAEGRLFPPIDHTEPARCIVTGTGLSHLGSAESRDAMHRDLLSADEAELSDSMKMFRMGLEGGKPLPGEVGVQPEWFYKGDGSWVVAPGGELDVPHYAEDGGEEPEIVGIYLIDDDGVPVRLGFALGNEFSDHVMERGNYLWLAHSKLRQSAIGPALATGPLADSVRGTSRIRRGSETVWERPFLTGEANMSHTIANLEGHHFKYPAFRRPGDVHVHFFGTATLSHSDGVRLADGDRIEIEAEGFGPPLRNVVRMRAGSTPAVRTL